MKLGSIAMKTVIFAAALAFFGTAYAATAPQDRLVMGKVVKDGRGYALQTPTGLYQIEDINAAAWQGLAVDVVGVPLAVCAGLQSRHLDPLTRIFHECF